jgi:hypothetical protein
MVKPGVQTVINAGWCGPQVFCNPSAFSLSHRRSGLTAYRASGRGLKLAPPASITEYGLAPLCGAPGQRQRQRYRYRNRFDNNLSPERAKNELDKLASMACNGRDRSRVMGCDVNPEEKAKLWVLAVFAE